MTSALSGLRILDMTSTEGHLCGRLMADLGAEVIKIESSERASGRFRTPSIDGLDGTKGSLLFDHFNINKKSIVADPASPGGRKVITELARTSDVILETFRCGVLESWDLGYDSLKKINPGIVMTSITGFGLSGPYKQFKAPSIVCAGMGGVMYLCGTPDKPPLAEPNDQPYHLASAFGAYGTILALRHRDATGLGQRVEISCQEVQAAQQHIIVNYSANANVLRREGSRSPIGGGMPYGVYETKDGYCHLVVISTAHWRKFVDWIGSPEALTDPIWDNRHVRIANGELIEDLTLKFTKTLSSAELFSQGQARHITIAPINSPDQYPKDRHATERKTFVPIRSSATGQYKTVDPPFKLTETPAKIFRPAPKFGEHSEEILKDKRAEYFRPKTNAKTRNLNLPLEGIRVLDLSQAIAGPVLTQLLGEFGAEVIKVESKEHQQRGRNRRDTDPRIVLQQKVTFADNNRNKRCISVNLSTAEGRQIIRRLVTCCDVVVENFSPRVMNGWGLNYEDLRTLRSDIIMVRLPGFGLTGPYRDYVGLAAVAMAITGMYHLWSYPEDLEPAGPPVWTPDYLSAAFSSVALLAALRHRDLTGQGQLIELSQVDTVAYILGTAYTDNLVNGRISKPVGNRHPDFAPQGAYRCKGKDAWCVLAVRSNKEWLYLCQALGLPDLADNLRYSSLDGRLTNHDELDVLIGKWTSKRTPHQVMSILQNAGVPAGAVQDGAQIFGDPQLRDRGFITTVEHPDTGPIEYPGSYVRLSEIQSRLSWHQNMGADNQYVFRKLLDMQDHEIKELEKAGILT